VPAHAIYPAGSFADPASCDGEADVSRDGILDLGGSSSELTLDRFLPTGERGITIDPVCKFDVDLFVVRGGSFTSGSETSRTSWRSESGTGPTSATGFRCAYPGVAP
jgi:formylglycine-generating enzyme required for sulfatase activity